MPLEELNRDEICVAMHRTDLGIVEEIKGIVEMSPTIYTPFIQNFDVIVRFFDTLHVLMKTREECVTRLAMCDFLTHNTSSTDFMGILPEFLQPFREIIVQKSQATRASVMEMLSKGQPVNARPQYLACENDARHGRFD
jgi:hypothetical protein